MKPSVKRGKRRGRSAVEEESQDGPTTFTTKKVVPNPLFPLTFYKKFRVRF